METWRHTAAFPQSAVPVQKRSVAAIKERPCKGLHTRSNALIFQCLWKKNLFIWPFPPRRADGQNHAHGAGRLIPALREGLRRGGRGLRLPAALHRRDAAARPEAGPGRQPLQGAGLRTVHAPRQESLSGRGEQHGTGHRRCRPHHGSRPRSTSYSSTCPARSTIRR